MIPNFPKIIILFFLILPSYLLATEVDSIASPRAWLEQQNEIGQKYLRENQEFDKAVNTFKLAHDFAVTHQLTEEFSKVSVGYGIALYKKGDVQNSYRTLLEVLPKISDLELKVKAEVNQIIGMSLVFKNKFPEGYKYQMEALKYYSDIGDSTGLMNTYYDLASNFELQRQFEMSLEYFKKGLNLAKSQNDTKNIILGTTSLSGLWAEKNDFDNALKFNDESLTLAKSINDKEELAWASINRGYIFVQIRAFEKSHFFLNQAYDLSFEIGNKLLTAYSCLLYTSPSPRDQRGSRMPSSA